MAYSSDGVSWMSATTASGLNSTNRINGFAFGNNRYVAATSQGRIVYSTDGATWTAVANSNGHINAVAYGNGRFVAVGEQGRMAYCDW